MDICKEVCAIKGLSKEAIPQHLGTLSDSFLISFDTSLNRYRFLEPVRGFAEHQLELSGEKEDILTSFENWWLPTTRMDDFTSIGSANRQYLGRILNEVANADSYVNHRSGGNDDTAIRALEAELQSSVIRFADGAFRTVRKRFTPFLSVLGRMPDRTRMKSFLTMAVLDFMAGDYSEAYVHATRGLAVAKQLSDRKHQALGNVGIGLCETFLNRPEGETHVREGLRIAQEIQDNWALGIGHMGVGAWHWQQGESALSLAEYLKSLDFFRKSEDNMMCALTLNSVAHLVRQGDMPVKAAHYYLESYDLSLDGNFKNGRGVAGCILGTCGLAITMKWDDEAALFWGAGTTHYEKLGAKAIPPIQTDYERDMLEVRNRMGVRYQTLYDEGTQLSLMDAAHRAHAVIKKISGLDHP